MKLTKQILRKFNTDKVALVISDYPRSGKKGKNHGIAWYTKKTIEPIATQYNQKFVVLAEQLGGEKPEIHANGNVLVLRVFEKGKLHLYPQVLSWLKLFNNVDRVYVHSEFGMNGSIFHFGLLIPFLSLVRLYKKEIYFFSHNVIDSVDMLSGHLQIKPGSLKARSLNLALRGYYISLATLTKKVVVLDHALANRLQRFMPKSKIITLPMPVKKRRQTLSINEAKKRIGVSTKDKVLMYFGFVSWYKGADWLIKSFNQYSKENPEEKIHLVIAGGPAYSMAGKKSYQKYYKALQEIARKNPKITISGFIAEEEVGTYFQAADLVVFPYRGLMGASGCMNWNLSYQKPLMVSSKMKQLFTDPTLTQSLSEVSLRQQDTSFEMSAKGLRKIISAIKNKQQLESLTRWSRYLAEAKNERTLMAREYQLLYKRTPKVGGILSWLAVMK